MAITSIFLCSSVSLGLLSWSLGYVSEIPIMHHNSFCAKSFSSVTMGASSVIQTGYSIKLNSVLFITCKDLFLNLNTNVDPSQI